MNLDLVIYHDFEDVRDNAAVPPIGAAAEDLYGSKFAGLYVAAITPGIHPGRVTVVLEPEPQRSEVMDMKRFFTVR